MAAGRVRRAAGSGDVLCGLAVLGEPLLAAAVHETHVLVAVELELPEGPRREPVVVVAVEDDRGVVGDPACREQLLQRLLRDDVSLDGVAELGLPVPADGARNVALVVGGGVHVHLDDRHVGVVAVLLDPIGRDQRLRMGVLGHVCLLWR
jgi:hypothetical protein